jgi:hypothetical protein
VKSKTGNRREVLDIEVVSAAPQRGASEDLKFEVWKARFQVEEGANQQVEPLIGNKRAREDKTVWRMFMGGPLRKYREIHAVVDDNHLVFRSAFTNEFVFLSVGYAQNSVARVLKNLRF